MYRRKRFASWEAILAPLDRPWLPLSENPDHRHHGKQARKCFDNIQSHLKIGPREAGGWEGHQSPPRLRQSIDVQTVDLWRPRGVTILNDLFVSSSKTEVRNEIRS